MDSWRGRVRQLQQETYALYLAYRDPRVAWYARVWVAVVVAYALSPIDLIPDFIPVLGYLDDLVLIPLGVLVAIRLIRGPVLAECRARAQEEMAADQPVNRAVVAVIVAIWLALALLAVWLFLRAVR